MPVSGLAVSLTDKLPLRTETIDAISEDSRIEIGMVEGNRLAIVIDTASNDEDKQLWNWLNALPGVIFVDVVMVGFEDSTETNNPTRVDEHGC